MGSGKDRHQRKRRESGRYRKTVERQQASEQAAKAEREKNDDLWAQVGLVVGNPPPAADAEQRSTSPHNSRRTRAASIADAQGPGARALVPGQAGHDDTRAAPGRGLCAGGGGEGDGSGSASAPVGGDGSPVCVTEWVLQEAKVVKVPGDGNCVFGALAYGLGPKESASALRKEVTDHIANKGVDMKVEGVPLSTWINFMRGNSNGGCDAKATVDAYACQMQVAGVWGGEIELMCVSLLRNVNVHVFQKDGETGRFLRTSVHRPTQDTAQRDVHVLFSNEPGWEHYDALSGGVMVARATAPRGKYGGKPGEGARSKPPSPSPPLEVHRQDPAAPHPSAALEAEASEWSKDAARLRDGFWQGGGPASMPIARAQQAGELPPSDALGFVSAYGGGDSSPRAAVDSGLLAKRILLGARHRSAAPAVLAAVRLTCAAAHPDARTDLQASDFATLAPGKLCNDNVVNAGVDAVALRARRAGAKVGTVQHWWWHYLCHSACANRFEKAARVFFKCAEDVFALDRLLVPILDEPQIHWALGCVDFERHELEFFCPLGLDGIAADFFKHALDMLRAGALNVGGEQFVANLDMDAWVRRIWASDVDARSAGLVLPKQGDKNTCGACVVAFADARARGFFPTLCKGTGLIATDTTLPKEGYEIRHVLGALLLLEGGDALHGVEPPSLLRPEDGVGVLVAPAGSGAQDPSRGGSDGVHCRSGGVNDHHGGGGDGRGSGEGGGSGSASAPVSGVSPCFGRVGVPADPVDGSQPGVTEARPPPKLSPSARTQPQPQPPLAQTQPLLAPDAATATAHAAQAQPPPTQPPPTQSQPQCTQPQLPTQPKMDLPDLPPPFDFDGVDAVLGEMEGELDNQDGTNSVMGRLLERVQERLKLELSSKTKHGMASPWLLPMLKKHGGEHRESFMLRASDAKHLCKQLGIPYTEDAYYRDICVWLPDVRWGCAITCPHCSCSDRTAAHGWRTNHFARRVVDLSDHFFIMSRRYVCHRCKEKHENDLRAAGVDARGSDVDTSAEDNPYTFMGYNPKSVALLPYGFHLHFPAVLTHRGALSMQVVDLMRPLFDAGVRPNTLSSLLLEMHTKRYHREYICREHLLHRAAGGITAALFAESKSQPAMFSAFDDKTKYAGLVPTGSYLTKAYITHGEQIAAYQDMEMKKRGGTMFCIDASYQLPKHLYDYFTKAVFRALQTGCNELGEVRLSALVVTDGHDQLTNPVGAMLSTMQAYGHPEIQLIATDKPAEDKAFFMVAIPSVGAMQRKLDQLLPVEDRPLPECELAANAYEVCDTVRVINQKVSAMCDVVGSGVISVDAEWLVLPQGPDKVAVIQLGYRLPGTGECKALILLVHKFLILPASLSHMFANTNFIFVGSCLKHDFTRIQASFQSVTVPNNDRTVRVIDLGQMASARGVVSKSASLEKLVAITLGQCLPKESRVRCSDWSVHPLTEKQERYAALDAIKALEVYHALESLPDLTARLTRAQLLPAVDLDVVPASGSVASMASCAAHATYVHDLDVKNVRWPVGMSMSDRAIECGVALRITQVFGTALIVPGLKRDCDRRRAVSLGELGQAPFEVVLPLTMLMKRVHSRTGCVHPANAHTPPSTGAAATASGAPPLPARAAAPATPAAPSASTTTPVPAFNAATTCTHPAHPGHPGAAGAWRRGSACEVGEDSEGKRNAGVCATGSDAEGAGAAAVSAGAAGEGSAGEGAAGECAAVMGADRSGENDDGFLQQLMSDDLFQDGDCDSLMVDLTPEELATIRELSQVISPRTWHHADKLGQPPQGHIIDRFSSVLGDPFHLMDRPKVPIRHAAKKPYFVALQEAMFAWDERQMDDVKKALTCDGLSAVDIEARLYFNVAFFRQRVHRMILPPSKLYWRLRAVYETYGPMEDPKTKAPLFNEAAWKKARNVLIEVLDGNISDPPGVSFYTHLLDKHGRPRVDRLGLHLYKCFRGTNHAENHHKGLAVMCNNYAMGVQLSSQILREHRHRYNHRISERERPGFPMIGHFDTWFVDMLQELVARNHNIRLFPGWSNTAHYLPTPEKFGTVRLHSDELHQAVEALDLGDQRAIDRSLTQDQLYLRKMTGTKLPFLPVHGEEEGKLFSKLMLSMRGALNANAMALEWCKHVDGKTIFPKLPVYLRTHYEEWMRNENVRQVVREAKPGAEQLSRLNAKTAPPPSRPHLPGEDSAQAGSVEDPTLDADGGEAVGAQAGRADEHRRSRRLVATAPQRGNGEQEPSADRAHAPHRPADHRPSAGAHLHPPLAQSLPPRASRTHIWPPCAPPPVMPHPTASAIRPAAALGTPFLIGGLQLSMTLPAQPVGAGNPRKRGPDARERQGRTCKRCKSSGGAHAQACAGRWKEGNCQYFTTES